MLEIACVKGYRVVGGVENHRVDDGVVHRVLPEDAGEDGSGLGEGPVQVAVEHVGVIGRLRGDEGVGSVERRVVALHPEVAVQLVGAGLGEDLDASEAQRVVLRRVGILVDADLADGGFGRQLSAGESIHVELRAGLGIGAGDGLELRLHFVGIVGEGAKIVALHDDCAAVGAGAGVNGRVGDDHLLLIGLDDQGKGNRCDRPRRHADVLLEEGAKTGGLGFNVVSAGCEAGDGKSAQSVGGNGGGRPTAPRQGYAGLGDDRSGGIGHRSGDAAGRIGTDELRAGRSAADRPGFRKGPPASRDAGRKGKCAHNGPEACCHEQKGVWSVDISVRRGQEPASVRRSLAGWEKATSSI